jgi:hypothetical protein
MQRQKLFCLFWYLFEQQIDSTYRSYSYFLDQDRILQLNRKATELYDI